MENKLIEGVLEDINKQLAELKPDHYVKVGQMTSVVDKEKKRIWLTVALELKEK